MLDKQSFTAIFAAPTKRVTWFDVVLATSLDFTMCLLSHVVVLLPFAFALFSHISLALLVLLAICAACAYTFFLLIQCSEAPKAKVWSG
jgi:hypothetical protein